MMKIIYFLLVGLCAIPSLCQSHTEVVTWGEKGAPFKIEYFNGHPEEVLHTASVWINVFEPLQMGKRLYAATVQVSNPGQNDIDVDPSIFSGCLDDERHSELIWTDGDRVIGKQERSARRRSAIAAGLASFGAAAQTQTATVENSDGSSSTVRYHDPATDEEARKNANRTSDSISRRYAGFASVVLRRNTVSPGGDVIGRVYFSAQKGAPKKAQISEVDVRIGGVMYRFVWDRGKPVPLQ